MREINHHVRCDVRKDRVRSSGKDRAPANIWNSPWRFAIIGVGKTASSAREEAQAADEAVLFTDLEHDLTANANTKERHSTPTYIDQRADQAAPIKFGHCIAVSTNPRQDDGGSPPNYVMV